MMIRLDNEDFLTSAGVGIMFIGYSDSNVLLSISLAGVIVEYIARHEVPLYCSRYFCKGHCKYFVNIVKI